MDLSRRIGIHKHWKQNAVEHALGGADDAATKTAALSKVPDMRGLTRFLKSNFGITNLTPVAGIICNSFFIGNDADGRQLFIKTGKYTGIYENEYKMGLELYEINPDHFLQPLYYHDNNTYNFFANEYVAAPTLATAIHTGTLNIADRGRLIGDIWRIFCALQASDVVHRDIRPDNFMIIDGRLVLIDFQLAVSKTNYVELEYLANRPNRLRQLGGKKYRYRPFVWDDAYSLLKVMEFIGRDKSYGMRYDTVYKHIKAYVGMAKIKSSVRENDLRRMVRHIRQIRI